MFAFRLKFHWIYISIGSDNDRASRAGDKPLSEPMLISFANAMTRHPSKINQCKSRRIKFNSPGVETGTGQLRHQISNRCPWRWLLEVNESISSTCNDFNYLYPLGFEICWKIIIYIYIIWFLNEVGTTTPHETVRPYLARKLCNTVRIHLSIYQFHGVMSVDWDALLLLGTPANHPIQKMGKILRMMSWIHVGLFVNTT